MVIGSPQGDDKTGRFTNARDIECGTCGLVIATTYSPRFTSADALRRVMGRR
jgi:hypothetical protein